MRARLLLIPFIFSVPAYSRTFRPTQRQIPRAGEIRSGPGPLPTAYGRRLDVRGSAGQSRGWRLPGQYAGRGILDGALLPEPWRPAAGIPWNICSIFFRDAATASGHPAPKLMMTDPYGIFGIFKAQPMQPEHAEWLAARPQACGKGRHGCRYGPVHRHGSSGSRVETLPGPLERRPLPATRMRCPSSLSSKWIG